MKWKAVAHRIIVKPDPLVEETQGGIVIARVDDRAHKNAQVTGTIVDIGEDAWEAFKTKRQFAGLKVGDRVAYAKYAGKSLSETELVLCDEDIVAVEANDDVDAKET